MVWYSVQERSRAGCGFSGYLSGYLSGCFPRRPTRMHHADSLASPRSVVDMQTTRARWVCSAWGVESRESESLK
jgi:hypothetical protein